MNQPHYTVLREVVGSDDLSQLRHSIDAHQDRIRSEEKISKAQLDTAVSAWGCNSQVVESLILEVGPTLAAACRPKFGIREDLVDATLFVKTSAGGDPTHAHQDLPYRWNRPLESRYAYTTWLALDDTGPNRGGMCFNPTYSSEVVTVRQDHLAHEFHKQPEQAKWKHGEVQLDMKAGDVVVFDSKTWHASAHFKGDGQRRALAIRWASESGWEMKETLVGPHICDDEFGMDTSGALLLKAITITCEGFHASGFNVRADVSHFLNGPWKIENEVRSVLDELVLALGLMERHHARPSARIWERVRDIVIPKLDSRREGGQC